MKWNYYDIAKGEKDPVWDKLKQQRHGFGDISIEDMEDIISELEAQGKYSTEIDELQKGISLISTVLSNLRQSLEE